MRAFDSRFMSCSRVPRPLDSLLSTTMRKGETLKTYFDRYWEMFNEIDGDFDDVVIRTEGISSWIDTITTGLGEISQGI